MTAWRETWRRARRWSEDERGGVLVEFAIVVSLFLFMMFSIIDFGRLAFSHVTAEKAVQIAVRRAIVRPPACAGVPERYSRGVVPGGTPTPRFGTSCRTASYVCAPVATISCAGNAANPTAQEIWTQIAPLLPSNAVIGNLQFTYSFDSNLGYLGGPYVPMVTVTANLPQFQFASPLGGLATAAGATGAGTLGTPITYPVFSVSYPAEDLAAGEAG